MLDRLYKLGFSKDEKSHKFVDIGCGSGKPVFAAALFHPFEKSQGIEILTELHKIVTEGIQPKWEAEIKANAPEHAQETEFEFIQGDALEIPWADADVVFMNSTCFDEELFKKLVSISDKMKKQLLSTAKASNMRLEELVNKILISTELSSSKGKTSSETLKVNEELERILHENISSLNVVVEIEADYGTECKIKLGKLEFETMMNNLIQNAIKYHNPDGKISIRTGTNSGSAQIKIEDQGPGIPDHEKSKIFDKFYRMGDEMTRATKGTGLGLFLVKEIVSKNNGKITVTDNVPNGCIFTLSFPIYS